MPAPVLKEHRFTRKGRPWRLLVEGGLHHIKGNRLPYFSLTCSEAQLVCGRWYTQSCGSMHERILKVCPELSDLAALHCSDIHGVPMHFEANGRYWIGGILGTTQDRHHGGNGSPGRTPGECLEIFARHCRMSMLDADCLISRIKCADDKTLWHRWHLMALKMLPRFAEEAESCIKRHGLVVYGAPWTEKEEGASHAGV